MLNFKVTLVRISSLVLLVTFVTGKRRFAGVTSSVFFEVTRVPELPAAVVTSESSGVGVDEQVIVEAVLPGEDCTAFGAFIWSEIKGI